MSDDTTLQLKKRFAELAGQASSGGYYTYTDFLSAADAADALAAAPMGWAKAFGGTEACERVIVRYGNPDVFGYDEPFPVRVLKVEPKNAKFADALTHRDFLGSIMALGITRDVLGDILLSGTSAYVFAEDQMAAYLADNLTAVRHTAVKAAVCEEVPEEARPRLESVMLTAAGERLDGVIAHLYRLSRGSAKELFDKGYVHVNGRECLQASRVPKENDIVSVRGFGKFVYRGAEGVTRKGNQVIRVDRYL